MTKKTHDKIMEVGNNSKRLQELYDGLIKDNYDLNSIGRNIDEFAEKLATDTVFSNFVYDDLRGKTGFSGSKADFLVKALGSRVVPSSISKGRKTVPPYKPNKNEYVHFETPIKNVLGGGEKTAEDYAIDALEATGRATPITPQDRYSFQKRNVVDNINAQTIVDTAQRKNIANRQRADLSITGRYLLPEDIKEREARRQDEAKATAIEYQKAEKAQRQQIDDTLRSLKEKAQKDYNEYAAQLREQEEKIPAFIRADKDAYVSTTAADLAMSVPAATLKLVDDTEKLLNAPKKGGNWANSMWAGAKDAADAESFFSFGLSGLAKSATIKGVTDRYLEGKNLTDKENDLMEALATNTLVAYMRKDDVSGWYTAGQIAEMSAEISTQFLGTNFIGSAATKAVARGIGKFISKNAPKIVAKLATKGLGGTALRGTRFVGKGAIDTFVGGTAQSLFMPNTYDSAIQTKTGTVAFGEGKGQYDVTPSEYNLAQSLVSGAIESVSERAGGAFAGFGGKVAKNIIPTSWGKLSSKGIVGDIIKAGGTANRYLSKAGINGQFGELAEEGFGQVLNRINGTATKEEWANFWSKDNMLQMIGGFAPMSLVGLGANTISVAKSSLDAYRADRALLNFARKNNIAAPKEMLDKIKNVEIENLHKVIEEYVQELGGVSDNKLNDIGVEFNKLAANVVAHNIRKDIYAEADSEVSPAESVSTDERQEVTDENIQEERQLDYTIPQLRQGDEVEYDNTQWIVGDVADEDGEYQVGEESIPLRRGNVLLLGADGKSVQVIDSVADLLPNEQGDEVNDIEARRAEIYKKYEPVVNVDTGNITQLGNVAGTDNIAYVVKGKVVYDEDGNIDYDKSDDTIYYKVYDQDGNEVDGGTPKPIYLKTRQTEFGKVLSDVPIEEYVDNELYPQEQNNIQQAINNGPTNIEQSTPEESVSTDEHQEVTDENGLPFVKTSNGVTDFGYIPEDTGLTPAPIRLSIGDERTGLQHIVDRHGEQIAKAGFDNVVDFVEYVASNYDTITEGVDTSGEPNGTYLLQAKDKHNNTLYVELSNDGSYWNINSGGVFRKGYGEKNKVVWSASEVQRGLKSATPDTLRSQDEADNQGDPNRTVSDTTSTHKGTTNKPDIQEEFYNSLPRNKKGEIDESLMSAEQKIRYAQAEFGEDEELVKEYISEQSKSLSDKIAKLANKSGKSVAEFKELAALKRDKITFVEYLNEQRQQAATRQTVEEAAADDRGRAEADIAEAVKEIDVEPTEAQKKAGNYKKGHVKIQGFDITIENPKGAIRRGVDDNGKAWSTEMKNHYGYFKNTEGKDGDHIDVFIGDNPNSKRIFVVDQVNPKTKEFDESKVMLGFDTEDKAKKAYLSNYSKDWKGFKDITYVDIDTFRDWLYDGAKQRKPFGEYSNIRFRSIKDINDRFNEELQQQIDGTLPKGHVYSLGMPNDILRSAGLPNLPIEMSAERLAGKSQQANHPFELSETEGLPAAIQHPIAIFDSTKNDGSSVILTELKHGDSNFVAVLGVRQSDKQRKIDVEVNSIRSLYPKTHIRGIIDWFNSKDNLLRWVDKEKALNFISTQEPNYLAGGDNAQSTSSESYLNSSKPAEVRNIFKRVAKVIKEFDNPTLSGGKNEETRFLSDISEIKPLVDKINGGLLKLKRMDTEGVYDLLRSVAELNNMANKGYYYLNVDEKLVNDKIYSLKERAVNKIAQELYNRDEYVGFDYNGVEKFDIVYFRDKQGRQISFHQYVTPEYVSDFTPIWDGITESWKDENIKFASKKNAELEKKKHIIGKKVREEYFKEIKDSEDELERDINNAGEDVRLIMKFGIDRALSQTSIFSDKFPDIAEQRKQLENRQRDVNKKLRYLQTFILKKESVLSRSSKQDTIEKLKSEIEKIETERTELRTESRLIENKLNGIERVVSLKWRGLPEVKKATELAERQFSLRQKHFLAERDIVEKMKSATREINDKYGDNVNEEIEKNIRVKAERDEAQQENKKLEELVTLLKKTGFADVKTGEDFYNALAEIEGSERYSSQSEKKLYNPRGFITPVRGEWTKEKIKKRLKESGGSLVGYDRAAKLISEFDSPEELAENIFYHGTVYGSGRLKPSILMSDMDVERYGGGGYGDKYWGISVSRSKKIASNFSGTSAGVSILPIVLAKGAKVKEMPDLKDSADIDDVIVDLWKEGVDAVWVGDKNKGEQELCVINPRAIVNINSADTYRVYGLGGKENPINIIDKEGIRKLYEDAKQYWEQKKIAPKGPLKPFRFYLDENNRIGDKKPDDVYDREMKEYEEQLRVYESSDEYKKWQRAQEYAQGNIRFMIGKQVDDISIVDGEDEDTRYRRPNGTVLGFVKGNTIYLNPDEVSLNTPIHEFGHLWVSQVKEHFPDLWAKGKELFLESDYLRKVQADPNYQHLDLDGQIDEAMARAIGDRGEQELDKTLLEKILDWIAEVWEKIGGVFGIENLTSEQISNLTLQDFTDMATSELLSGENLTERVNGNRGGATRYNTAEETADIKAKAISDGTFMKAPNGKDTNLTERQWLQVRTKAFKKWFGDWEKTARIEKLKKTKPIEITGEEVKPSDDLKEYKKNALEYGKTLQGEYTNKDTGITIQLQRGRKNGGLNEVLQHDYKDREHLQSIAAIPQIIENATYIDSEPNNDIPKNPDVKEYQYYVCGLKIGGEDYTVRAVVAVDNKGDRYYDHKLTNIEKGKLLDQINSQAIKNNGFGTTPGTKPTTVVSEYKDSKLISLLQENSSKVVDENGEPLVVYHGTNKFGFTVFDKEFSDDKTSIFFTDKVDIAKGYAGVNADVRSLYDDDTAGGYSKDEMLSMLFADVDISSHTNGWDVANDILPYITEDIGITAEYDDEDGVLTLSSDYTGDTYRLTDEEFSWEKVENWLRDNADLENVIDKNAGIYGVFVNARNVLDIDAGGSMWSYIPKKKVKGAEGVGNMDTRDIVEHAKKLNYDGVYIKDLLDTGGRGYGLVGDIEGDIFISLVDKNQIKSATDNIGTFGVEDEDIRYMLVNVQDEKAIDEERHRPKFEIKGDDVYTTMYTTRVDTETEIDVLYNGNDFEKALSEAEGYNENSDREDLTVSVEAMRLKIPVAAIKDEYDYDDEEYDGDVAPFVEDYIDDFVEDVDYDRYETGRDMFDVYKSKPDTDEHELIGTITDKLQQQTGLYIGKYSTFYITKNGEITDEEADKDGVPNAFVSMRIADHTHNRHNGDSTLNIVVADDDPTKTKFQSSKEDLRYTTKDNAEEIVKDILDFWRQYAREYFGDINKQFNDDLDEFERNRLLSSRKFNLGRPSPILMSVGLNGVSIQMTQSVLSKHLDKHNLKTDDLRELPEAIRTPIMVYEWGDKARNSVIVTFIPRGEDLITTTIRLTRDGNKLNVNEISSIYGKSAECLIRDINTPKSEFGKDNLRYVDKKQVLDWFAMEAPKASSQTQQELITATKVIENFENPPINEKKVIDDTTNDMVRYSIRANDQLDREDEIMGKKAAEIYEARVKLRKQMNQSDPKKMPNKEIFDDLSRKTEAKRMKFVETVADQYRTVKSFVDTLNEHGYNISDYNNWYMNVFALAGKNEAEFEKYQAERSKPLQRAAKAAMDSGQISYRELENYLILKHGQERNEYFTERDKGLGIEPLKDYSGVEAVMFEEFCKRTGIEVKTQKESVPQLAEANNNIDILYADGVSEFSENGRKLPIFEVERRFAEWKKVNDLQSIIADYEQKIGKDKIDDLWAKINYATQFVLDMQKAGGLTSEKMYEKASGMWKYFVPLRGFDVGTAKDEFDYDLNGVVLFTDFKVEPTLGRTRRSTSPLVWTEQMAHITIDQKNRNLLNQSLRRLASISMARRDNILLLSKLYKDVDAKDEDGRTIKGEVKYPPKYTGDTEHDAKAYADWIAEMKAGIENGTIEEVRQDNVNFGKIVPPAAVKQHIVRVYEGGVPTDVIFNTPPAVPRAINGLNHKTAISNHWIYKNLKAGTRMMAQTMTTLNPAFVGKNFSRDYLFANTMLFGREDMSYVVNFNKNITKATPVLLNYVKGKSLLGWAAGDKGNIQDNEYGKWLTEFVMNGGKTGFSQMLKFEKMSNDFKKQTEKGDKKVHYGVNDYIHFIEALNDYAENITRFSAYCASRQAGRSIERSISDAKELTINFNRKGTDGGIWGAVRSLCAFSNASIQALVVFSRGVRANPKRMSVLISGYTAMAITMAVIAKAISGDDDKNDYFKLSKFDRQNNLCLPMFGGGFLKIPLPQEMRVFYKLGDEIALCLFRNEPPEVAAQEVFMGALDLLPSFAAGATSISDVLDEKIGAGDLLLAHQPITAIQPITQLMSNRNFLNYRIYDDSKWGGRRKELPEYRKALRNKGGETYSPNFVVKLSEGISRLTGGSDLKRGLVEANPDMINHLMRGYFGGLYSSAVAAINMGDKGAQSIAAGEWRLKSTDSPTMKAFYVSPSNLRYTDDILNAQYMDVLKEAKKHANVYANYLKEGEVDRFEKETKMTEDEALDWRYLVKGIDKEVQELRNEIAIAETTKERDEALRQLETLQREAIDMAAKLKK